MASIRSNRRLLDCLFWSKNSSFLSRIRSEMSLCMSRSSAFTLLASIRQITVLHQCIRPLLGACAPGHHGYQRASDLISGQASTGPFGSPVFACAGKTDPPSSSHPLADLGGKRDYVIACSCSVQFLCSCQQAVPSSRPAQRAGRRAQGRSRLAALRGHPFEVKHYVTALSTFLLPSSQFLCSTWNPVSSPRPARVGRRRAQGLSRPAVALPLLTLRCLEAAP